jgi:hypothetical protein
LPALLCISNKNWFVLVFSPAPTICPVGLLAPHSLKQQVNSM